MFPLFLLHNTVIAVVVKDQNSVILGASPLETFPSTKNDLMKIPGFYDRLQEEDLNPQRGKFILLLEDKKIPKL